LNAYRHEALVKRLFKRAEAAGDDAVMARFIVAFDRSIRRVLRTRRHHEQQRPESRGEAARGGALWRAQGFESGDLWENRVDRSPRFVVWGIWTESRLTTRDGTTMPRGKLVEYVVGYDRLTFRPQTIQAPDWIRKLELDVGTYCDAVEPPEPAR